MLTSGEVIKTDWLTVTHLGYELGKNEFCTLISPLQIEGIFRETDRDMTVEEIQNGVENSKVAGILLELELLKLAAEKKYGNIPNTIVVSVSASLTLSILPGRESHDRDPKSVTDKLERFILKTACDRTGMPELEICSHTTLLPLGRWEERACTILGQRGTQFLVLHPLDTLSHKLLRIENETFVRKDEEEITQILERIKPTKKTLLWLLQEGVYRFFTAHKESREAAIRNTRWFLEKFLPSIDLQRDIIEPASEKNIEELARMDLAPDLGREWLDALRKKTC